MKNRSSYFRQARWQREKQIIAPLIFELGGKGRVGHIVPESHVKIRDEIGDPWKLIPKNLRREELEFPEASEVEVVRHYVKLSQMNYGVDSGPYYLGSCTMKYNPKINEAIASLGEVSDIHPYQDEDTVQGALEIMYKLEKFLVEITGLCRFTLQPAAGAHGEFVGVQIIRAYHEYRGEGQKRKEIIVPDSAHGTNPASSAMCGFKVVTTPSDESGSIDIEALKAAVSEKTAGIMLTIPNTLGLFEKRIMEVVNIVHDAGGLVYYDGANLNSILGKVRIADLRVDVAHLNLHKTFSTPHGGGGPGGGPIGVTEELEKFLPVPLIEYDGEKYRLACDRPHSIGKVKGFYGNFAVLVKAFAYIITLGAQGLEEVSELAVLNANYMARKLREVEGYTLPYDPEAPRKHEFVLSATPMKRKHGVTTLNVAKRLLDFGLHSPTIYFPLIVSEALMIEPTETETLEDLNKYIEVLKKIAREAKEDPDKVLTAPHNTAVSRLDEVEAARKPLLSWRMYRKRVATP